MTPDINSSNCGAPTLNTLKSCSPLLIKRFSASSFDAKWICENLAIACLDSPSILPDSSPAWMWATGIFMCEPAIAAINCSPLSPASKIISGLLWSSMSTKDSPNADNDFTILWGVNPPKVIKGLYSTVNPSLANSLMLSPNSGKRCIFVASIWYSKDGSSSIKRNIGLM